MVQPKKTVTLYTRSNCHLCKRAYDVVQAIARDYPLTIRTIDIDQDKALIARFGESVPAIQIDSDIVAEGRISEFRLRRHLGIPATPRQLLGLGRSLVHGENPP